LKQQQIFYLHNFTDLTDQTMKQAPILSPASYLAFNSSQKTLIAYKANIILHEESLSRNEAHLFFSLYLTYPDYAPDFFLVKALCVETTQEIIKLHQAPCPSSYLEEDLIAVGRAILGLRRKLFPFNLSVTRLLKMGCLLTGLPLSSPLQHDKNPRKETTPLASQIAATSRSKSREK
jgi:hypothetical protein